MKLKTASKIFTIGRVYFVSPAQKELFALRVLLHHVPGPTSYEMLKRYQDEVYPTFQAACVARGLLQDDAELDRTLDEYTHHQTSAHNMRDFFAVLLRNCNPSDPQTLWDKYIDHFVADFLRDARAAGNNDDLALTENMKIMALQELDRILRAEGDSLARYPMMRQPPDDMAVLGEDIRAARAAREVADELGRYDRVTMRELAAANLDLFTEEQRAIYEEIVRAVHQEDGTAFMLLGSAGCGKTFLYNTILAQLRSEGRIAIGTASSGIAALLISGATTAHSRFKIPVKALGEHSTSHLAWEDPLADVLRKADFICWDEAPMMGKHAIMVLDKLLRDLLKVDKPFGGKVVLFGGDFRQTLPVVKRGSRGQIVNACMPNCALWQHIQVRELTKNMRVHRLAREPGVNAEDLASFSDYLLRLGNGDIDTFDSGDIQGLYVPVPQEVCVETADTEEQRFANIFEAVYPNFAQNYQDVDWIMSRALLAPLNKTADALNEYITEKLPEAEQERLYPSADTVTDPETANLYPLEFLNSLYPSGIPPHALRLKPGMPIILLRTISPNRGLCNGTRLICRQLLNNVIIAEIASGSRKGEQVAVPRMELAVDDSDFPFHFIRRQFPVKRAYAMTINKSQGQSLKLVGLYLHEPVFTHGQLYVGCSRVSKWADLRILGERALLPIA